MLARMRHAAATPHVCVTHDAADRIDPTRTGDLRRKLRSEIDRRLASLRRLLREVIVQQDMLGLGGPTAGSIALASEGEGDKVLAFSRWFQGALYEVFVGGEALWVREHVRTAYTRGLRAARRMVRSDAEVSLDRADVFANLASLELQGVADALNQAVARVVSHSLLERRTTRDTFAAIEARISSIAKTRARAVANVAIVSAYNGALLDLFEAAHVPQVGVTPERLRRPPPVRVGDARRGRRSSPPSRSTISRIRRRERELERMREVEVLTAGDNDVCEICEEISLDGPYPIDTARSLIPAHPNCRCAFVPAHDQRFAEREGEDGDED